MNSVYQILRAQLKLWLGKGVFKSYSQEGEDVLMRGLLSEVGNKGIYVDVGSYHPIQYSNTYALYRRGWRGFVIDPNSNLKLLYWYFRRHDRFINVGVGEQSEEDAEYYRFTDGAYNTFDATEAEVTKQRQYPVFMGKSIVPIIPLSKIVNDYQIKKIDLLTIDVEGMDLQVLRSHDWSILPTVVIVEDNSLRVEEFNKSEVFIFMHAKGYSLEAVVARTLIFKIHTL
ncbi:MAG: FkbM family methyltransferase [Candidatus Pacebacteria bacterium]|nr:FkbM family methyltransferase [Candidatus Paceibacterota bacterium]MBP9832169.1 FkbM family methyltransferase [Candidatus Paceibacterota bacterium]